mgnify:FL=1|tara:strand:+ start:203 stop:460 length:258 start_codon:yes stop_codon:yes gene_type:complete
MDKIIKCLLLDVDNVIISEVEEVEGADIGEPDCKLIRPYLFESIDDMKPWPKATDQKELLIRSDSILTMADPAQDVTDKYLELTK